MSDQVADPQITDEFIEEVENAVGMGRGAWDMTPAKEILSAAIRLWAQREVTHPTPAEPRAASGEPKRMSEGELAKKLSDAWAAKTGRRRRWTDLGKHERDEWIVLAKEARSLLCPPAAPATDEADGTSTTVVHAKTVDGKPLTAAEAAMLQVNINADTKTPRTFCPWCQAVWPFEWGTIKQTAEHHLRVCKAHPMRELEKELSEATAQIANYQTYGQGGATFNEAQWIERLAQAEQTRDAKIEELQQRLADAAASQLRIARSYDPNCEGFEEDAEVRELILRYDGSDPSYEYPDSDVTSLAQDYLRLKAAVRLVHARYDPGDVGPEPKDFIAAVLLLEHVAKEPSCP